MFVCLAVHSYERLHLTDVLIVICRDLRLLLPVLLFVIPLGYAFAFACSFLCHPVGICGCFCLFYCLSSVGICGCCCLFFCLSSRRDMRLHLPVLLFVIP